jgi:hypothetical protein
MAWRKGARRRCLAGSSGARRFARSSSSPSTSAASVGVITSLSLQAARGPGR